VKKHPKSALNFVPFSPGFTPGKPWAMLCWPLRAKDLRNLEISRQGLKATR
jgi:hypothetical protein